jgi:hypothetical protein
LEHKVIFSEQWGALAVPQEGTKKMANTSIVTTTSKEIYIPFGGASIDLGEEATMPAPEFPLLQYATGLPAQRPKLDGNGLQMIDEDTGEALMDNLYYAGFFTQHGKDKVLDAAMQAHGIPWIDIVHGNGEVVRHWAMEKPVVFLIGRGVPSNANSNGSMGMAYLWRQKRDGGKSETVLYAQVVIRQLLPDFVKPFVFTVKSTQTADALAAMRRQYKVISYAHEVLRRLGRDMALPLWSYSLLLGASKKQENRGQAGASKTIFPMLSGVPDDISQAYLQKQEIPLEFVDHFRELAEKAVEWAQGLTERIAAGVESHEPWKVGSEDVQL